MAYCITCTKFIDDSYDDFTEYDNFDDYFDDKKSSYQPLVNNPVIVFTEQDRKKVFLKMWLSLIYKPQEGVDLTAEELISLLDIGVEGEQKINEFLTQMNDSLNYNFYYLADDGELTMFKNRYDDDLASPDGTMPEYGEIVDINKVVCAYCDSAWGDQYDGCFHYIKGVTVAEIPLTAETIKEAKPICAENTNIWNKPVNFGSTFPEKRRNRYRCFK